jgi:hypothetical protein
VDIADPSAPQLLFEISDGLSLPIGVAVSGQHVFVSNLNFDNVAVYKMNGMETNALIAHTAKIGGLQVLNEAIFSDRVSIHSSLNVGTGGILSNGPLSVSVSSTSSSVKLFNPSDSATGTSWGAHIGKLFVSQLPIYNTTGSSDYSMVVSYDGGSVKNGLCIDDANTLDTCPFGSGASILADGAITASAFDLAEIYSISGSANAGDLLILDTANTSTVKVSEAVAYDSRVIGIASTDPGFVLGWNDGVAVALTGRVPLNISVNNGPILAGDPLTSSNVAGYAMKATKPGMIVGYALHDQSSTGTVETFVNVGYWAGDILATDGTISTVNDALTVQPIGPATASSTEMDSYGFTFRGEAWDNVSSTVISSSFTLLNDIINATTSRFTIRSTSGTDLFAIDQDGDATIAGSLAVGGKLFPSSKGGGIQEDWYIFVDDTSSTAAYISTNAEGWQSQDTYDFAERYYSPDELDSGDLVIVSDSGFTHVQRTLNERQMVLGIVSTRPAFIAGRPATSTYPIALSGRVPTKVSSINGAIKAGDPLAPTTIPGVAAKAVQTGPIVGLALEDFDSADVGKIEVFVNPGWWTHEEVASSEQTQTTHVQNFGSARRGVAKIATGSKRVRVTFNTLNAYPFVQATPRGLIIGNWGTDAYSDTGFDIILQEEQTFDVYFSWSVEALSNEDRQYNSDGTVSAIDSLTGQDVETIEEPTSTESGTDVSDVGESEVAQEPVETSESTPEPPVVETEIPAETEEPTT